MLGVAVSIAYASSLGAALFSALSDVYKRQAELHLETGRTHQIRVHMKYIGHPPVSYTHLDVYKRQLLHRLKFRVWKKLSLYNRYVR